TRWTSGSRATMRPSSSTSELDPGFTTPALSACFSADARVRRMLDVEAALARAAADCGLVSTGVAEEIAGACASLDVDAPAVLAEGWEVGTPVVALLGPLRAALSSDAAEVVGFGATTQDIVDTAAQLQLRDALDAVD